MSVFACPECGGKATQVLESRKTRIARSQAIRRRRVCVLAGCKHTFTTYEMSGKAWEATREAMNEIQKVLNNWRTDRATHT